MTNTNPARIRLQSLDALRGVAILMMIFSGTIPFNDALPAWMYHAQLPPPDHKFLPDWPGITWVDLVFPFFLFSMGAAIPFSLGGKLRSGMQTQAVVRGLLLRFIGLAAFAILTQHLRPWGMNTSSWSRWVFSLVGFTGLLLVYGTPKSGWWQRNRSMVVAGGAVLLAGLLGYLHSTDIVPFKITRFDIILMILANTALVGGLLYLLFYKYPQILWMAYGLTASFFIAARDGENWITPLYNWSPAPWLVSWNYLKYLLILIPGIYTGQVILNFLWHRKTPQGAVNHRLLPLGLAGIFMGIILVAVVGLYLRSGLWSLLATALLIIMALLLTKRFCGFWKEPLSKLGPLLIALVVGGYLLEPLHGGIKKDPATLSYLVLTAGLALVALAGFLLLVDELKISPVFSLFTGAGKNAMLAYIAGSNVVIPVFKLTGIDLLFNNACFFVFSQTLRAVVITLLVAWLSGFLARRGLLMKV